MSIRRLQTTGVAAAVVKALRSAAGVSDRIGATSERGQLAVDLKSSALVLKIEVLMATLFWASVGSAAENPAIASENSATNTSSPSIAEVIVTAQKKTESAQDVPISISAISGDRLNELGATQLSDYSATVPGLQVDSGGTPGFVTVTMRGVSTGAVYGSSTTAIYVDGVPTGSSSPYATGAANGLDLLPFDTERVEVLKGPQGTLYGASSMGGLLQYVLTTPDVDETSFKVGGDLSTTDEGSGTGTGVRGYANLVIVPGSLAVSVSGAHSRQPGFITNFATGEEGINDGTQDGGRVALFWRPTDDFSMKLTALVNRSDFDSWSQIVVTPAGDPVYGRLSTREDSSNARSAKTNLYSADINYAFGPVLLTSVTGYSDAENSQHVDATVYPFIQQFSGGSSINPSFGVTTVRKFSQELRLTSDIDRPFQWALGGFYTRETAGQSAMIRALDTTTRQPLVGFDPLQDILIPSKFEEAAAFGNVTYEFTPEWDVNVGARYSRNEQSVSTVGRGVNGSAGLLFGSLTAPFSTPVFESSESVATYSLSSRYHFSPEVMGYVRVATGYRPGGSNQGTPNAPEQYQSDKLTNYEFGLKSELFDRRLRLNASAFYIDWSDVQISQYTEGHLIYTGNAGKATSQGIELEVQLAVTDELRLGVNTVYNDAKLATDAEAAGGSDGDQLPLSSEWSGAVTGDWRHPLSGSYVLNSGFVWRYVDDRVTDFPLGGNFATLPSYNTLSLSAGLSNGRWTARINATNVTNESAYLRYYAPTATLLEPRTIGISGEITF